MASVESPSISNSTDNQDQKYDFSGDFENNEKYVKAENVHHEYFLRKEWLYDKAEEKWACGDLTLLSYRPEKKIQNSNFRIFYLSLKLEELVDVVNRDKEWIIQCFEQFGKVVVKSVEVCFRDMAALMHQTKASTKRHAKELRLAVDGHVAASSVLKNAQETKEHLREIRSIYRDKAKLALSKALPLPPDALAGILDKFVETQDEEDPDNPEVWKYEESKIENFDQDDIELYIAMAEMFKALKEFRNWVFQKVLKFMKICTWPPEDDSD